MQRVCPYVVHQQMGRRFALPSDWLDEGGRVLFEISHTHTGYLALASWQLWLRSSWGLAWRSYDLWGRNERGKKRLWLSCSENLQLWNGVIMKAKIEKVSSGKDGRNEYDVPWASGRQRVNLKWVTANVGRRVGGAQMARDLSVLREDSEDCVLQAGHLVKQFIFLSSLCKNE